ncbi:MAG: Rrf2 family transcriptional regulator [Candidatus Methanomethylophilaceae archaeon]|jgi:Rrf2 family protein
MKISTKGRYALRVMIDLAQNSKGEYISLKEIAQRQEISIKYLEMVVSMLSKDNLVQSLRGKYGGYRLTRDPKEYTVGCILKKMEGNLSPVSCLDGVNTCSRADHCITLPMWKQLDRAIDDYLESVTLQDLLDQKKFVFDEKDIINIE